MASAGRLVWGRTVSYDNLVVGSKATTGERTIAGSLPPDPYILLPADLVENVAVGSDRGKERLISGSALMENEFGAAQ